MKRMISILLAAVTLLSLMCVSVFAQTSVNSVNINFTIPHVGDEMTQFGDTVITEPSVICNLQAIYTGEDINAILKEKDDNNIGALEDYVTKNTVPATPYGQQEYLVIFSLYSNDVTLSSDTKITSNSEAEGGVLYVASVTKTLYAYLLFTPTVNESEGDNAGDSTSDTTSSELTQNVSVSYNEVIPEKIYSFDITWQEMKFTYTPDTKVIWNPATHEYDSPDEAGWHSETNEIIVKNHSDFEINAKFEYAPEHNFTGITGSFLGADGKAPANNIFSVESAVGTEVSNPPFTSVFLSLDGTLAANTIKDTKSGTVTITIQ